MQEAGIRVALKGRRETAAELAQTERDLTAVGDSAEKSGRKASLASRGWSKARGVLGGVLSTAGRIVKGGVLTATAVGVGLIGTALVKGFQRLTGIENATAKLDGLGHSGKSVKRIMDNALASVKGTAFGMDEAATTAAGAVAAGVKPGRDLERTLKLVADAATIGGTSMGEMGSIFNKVATSNKVQADVMNQLSDRGIPIVQLLAKELGVTAGEVTELAKEGKIGFDTFRKAMDRGMGGAALDSGKTTTGVLKNVQAALGRLGAGLLGGVFPLFKPLGNEAIVVIDGLTERLAPLTEKLNSSLGPAMAAKLEGSGERILGTIDRWTAKIGGFIDDYRAGGLQGVFDGLQIKGAGETTGALSSIGGAFGQISDALSRADWGAVKENLGSGLSDTVSVFSVVIGYAADNVDTLAKYLPLLVAGFVAYKAAQAVSNVVSLGSIPIQGAQIASNIALANANRALAIQMGIANGVQTKGRVATMLSTAATVAQTVATKVATGAQKAMNLVMRMNPIGLVITGIMLLVGGFIMLYKRSQTVRDLTHKVWGVMKTMGLWIKDKLVAYLRMLAAGYLRMARFGMRAFRWLVTAAIVAFDGILSAAEKGLGWVPGIGGKIKKARNAFQEFGNKTIEKLTGVENKLRDAEAAANGLAKNRSWTMHVNYTSSGSRHPAQNHGIPREKGGPVTAGTPYVVGEKRPELFVPKTDGVILPRVPDLSSLGEGTEVSVGQIRPGGPTTIQLVMPDGRLITELVLDEYADLEART